MTDYTFENGEIRKGNVNVGWLAPEISNYFNCVAAIKNTLESNGHKLNVLVLIKDPDENLVNPGVRIKSTGVYIADETNKFRYAYFSNDMNCNLLCARAVLKEVVT